MRTVLPGQIPQGLPPACAPSSAAPGSAPALPGPLQPKPGVRHYELVTAAAGAKPGRKRSQPMRLAADSAITNDQKGWICREANTAYTVQLAKGKIPPGLSREKWRQQQQRDHFRLYSLKQCSQGQFRAVLSHFQALQVDDAIAQAKAFQHAMRAGQDDADRDLAWHLLEEACKEYGFGFPSYPDSICRPKFKRPLTEATPEQLTALMFDCKARGRSQRRKGGAKSPPTSSAPTDDSIPF